MSETTGLVTWNAPENLGKVPDSDWMCPVEGVAKLSFYEKRGGEVTDDDVQRLAGGRPQYLELLRYPEGYHTLQVVHAETGKILTDEASSRRYNGYVSYRRDSRIDNHLKPGMLHIVDPSYPLDLGEDRRITSFATYGDKSRAVIYSTPSNTFEAEVRWGGSMCLETPTGSLNVFLNCKAGSFDGQVKAFIRESKNVGVEAVLMVMARNPAVHFEQVNLRLDATGQVKGVDGDRYSTGFLGELGVNTSHMTWKGEKGVVTDSEHQKVAADSIAEILGMPSWAGIDLRMTASGLYAALGHQRPDFNEIVVPLDDKSSTLVKQH